MGQRHQVIGMRGAGSLILEFMLTKVAKDYDISFPDVDELRQASFRTLNPPGKVPVLICPDGHAICETLATCVYPAYHRQHRTEYYALESAFNAVQGLAVVEQAPAYHFIEEMLCPFLCGATPFAADFYLYMLARWDLDSNVLLDKRPKLAAFMAAMRAYPMVDRVLAK